MADERLKSAKLKEQVVHGVEFEAFDGVFGVGRGEDHHRALDQRTHEVHAVEIGHVDVHEDQFDGMRGEELLGFEGVVARSGQFEVGDLADVGGELTQRQRFVVYG